MTPILIVLSICLAIVVNRAMRGIHIFRALYFVPAVSGSIAIGLAWTWLFDRNGFINSVLLSWGLIETPIQWLSNPSHGAADRDAAHDLGGRRATTRSSSWPGLQNIPEELYDAARIDGCSDLQKHWHVSIPGLRPQITFVAVISSLAALKVFDEIYVLTGPDRRDPRLAASRSCSTCGSRRSCCGHAGYASAIAIALLAITLVFSIVNVRFLERGQGEA